MLIAWSLFAKQIASTFLLGMVRMNHMKFWVRLWPSTFLLGVIHFLGVLDLKQITSALFLNSLVFKPYLAIHSSNITHLLKFWLFLVMWTIVGILSESFPVGILPEDNLVRKTKFFANFLRIMLTIAFEHIVF